MNHIQYSYKLKHALLFFFASISDLTFGYNKHDVRQSIVAGFAHTARVPFTVTTRTTTRSTNILRKIHIVPHCIRTSTSISTTSLSNSEDDVNDDEKDLLSYAQSKLDIKGVTLKMAFDTSYAVADASEDKSERFTCSKSLDMVHKLRRWSDAVLVGRSTVQRDDCTLTVRRVSLLPNNQKQQQPARVVFDPSLKIIQDENEYALLKDGHRVLIYHSNDTTASPNQDDDDDDDNNGNDTPKQKLLSDNVELIGVGLTSSSLSSSLSINEIVSDLYSRNINHIMVEGGPATAISFLNEKLVDRAIIVRSPVTFIEPVPSGMTNEMLINAGLVLLNKEQCGDDIIEYWSKDGLAWPSINFGGSDDNTNEMIWPY
jgi:riboflavin biosynthesis pyrimidine reductase